MQTLTLQITNTNALQALKELVNKKAIMIISKDEMYSPALPGTSLRITAMKQWIAGSEASPAISLKTAKSEWANRRKQLQKLGK